MTTDVLPQTRMIEVYATDPADAQDAARAIARDDMGLHVSDVVSVQLRRPLEQYGDRFIYQVTVRAVTR